MFEDDLGDERDPLPPEDRLWRHPSEVGASRRAELAAAASTPSHGSRPMFAVAVVAGLTGAAVAVTALALTGSLSPRVIERQPVVSSAQLASATTAVPTPKTVRALVREASGAVAQIQVVLGTSSERTGSAVVLRADGALLTSAALVRDATSVKVHLSDGRQVDGTVAGLDPEAGLAVVKVPVEDLTPLTRAATQPKPGDVAVAVAGRPGPETEPSATSGVVSSLDRTVRAGDVALWGLIETDFPVPPAADGGALVGPDGTVTGISLHLAGSEPAANGGMGYSVPIDVAWLVGLDLLEHGRARAAWLGVKGDDLSEADAEALGVEGGVELNEVTPGSPGAVAGLLPDDVVIRLDTTTVRTMTDLKGSMKAHRPGERVTVLVVRSGQRTTLSATLGEQTG